MQMDEQALQDRSKDYFFLFCVRYTSGQIFYESDDRVVYHKDATAVAMMDIMDRWNQFPNPAKILKMGMDNIICLTFLKPKFMESKKSSIVCGILYGVAHTPGLNNAEKKALEKQFHAMVRCLLTEAPNIDTLNCILNELTHYFHSEEPVERELATSSIHVLLTHALRFNNMTRVAIEHILPPELFPLFHSISEADVLAYVADVFPVLNYEE